MIDSRTHRRPVAQMVTVANRTLERAASWLTASRRSR
jgi:hypothetical protein